MMKKLLIPFVLVLALGVAYAQFGIGIYTPGSGNPVAAGSITNLAPFSATLYRTSLVVTNSTNSTRVFNMFDASVATNMAASVSTGGITVTNDGVYLIGISGTFRPNTNQSGGPMTATNIMAATTNSGSVGTNLTSIKAILSTVRTNNFHYNFSSYGQVFLPSNSVVGLGYYNIGASGTNDIAFELASLSVTLIPGSTGGTSGSGVSDGIGTNLYTSVKYVNADGGSAIANATLWTNAVQSSSSGGLVVIGPGTYKLGSNEVALTLKNGVDQYFSPGAIVTVGLSNTVQHLFTDADVGAVTCRIWGYGRFYLTNTSGGGDALFLTQSGSSVYWEHDSVGVWGEGSSIINVENDVTAEVVTRRDGYTSMYDGVYNGVGVRRFRWSVPYLDVGGDLFEFGTGFTNRGDCVLNIGYGRSRAAGSFFALAANVEVYFGFIENTDYLKTTAQQCSAGAYGTGYGYLIGGTVKVPTASTNWLFGRRDATSHATAHFKNVTFEAPNWDTFLITNSASGPTILENCSIVGGGSLSTNVAFPFTTPATVQIRGSLNLTPYKKFHASITKHGTNVLHRLHVTDLDAVDGVYAGAVFGTNVSVEGGIFSMTGTLDDSSTNLIASLTEVNTASTNFTIAVLDRANAVLREEALGNIAVDWSNLTGVPAGFADGTDDGGGGSPVGPVGAIQFVEASALYGTNRLHFDPTNSVLMVSNNTEATVMVRGTSGTTGILRAGGGGAVEVGSTNGANVVLKTYDTNRWVFRGLTSGGANAGDIVPGAAGYQIGYPYGSASSVQIDGISSFAFKGGQYSNAVYTIPSNSSVMTIYGTNQHYRARIVGNITFADSDLSSNVIYRVFLTNNASTITWPASWRWIDGKTVSSAPSMQGGDYILAVRNSDGQINAWQEVGPGLEIGPGPGYTLSTNNGIVSWLIAPEVTNLIGTVARNVTNVVSLSTSNATSKPLTNSHSSGVLKLYGAEAGANMSITDNGSNLVFASTASGGASSFNFLPQSPTNYIPIPSVRMAWGKYSPNQDGVGSAGVTVSGDFPTPAAYGGDPVVNKAPSLTNSTYGVRVVSGGTSQANLDVGSAKLLFNPTNTIFYFSTTIGFSNSVGTNRMFVGIEGSSFSFGDDNTRLGWRAITKGSTETNWVAEYYNGSAFVQLHTNSAKTGSWHQLGIGNTNGGVMMWYMDGVPVISNATPGNITLNTIGGRPLMGIRNELTPTGTNHLFWQDFEATWQKVTPVSTGPL